MERAIRLSELLARVGLDDFEVGNLAVLEVPAEPRKDATQMGDEREMRPHRLAAMGIPQETIRLLEHSELMRDTGAMEAVRELLQSTSTPWGVIAGAMGSGKSVAVGWWLTQVRTGRGEGRFYVASEDVARIPLGTVYGEERVAQLLAAQALVLDDVGVRDGGQEGKLHPTLQRILSRRYEHRLDMACTTNLTPDDWESYLGDPRLVDRWREIGTYKVTADASLRRRTA
jgi:hypothetical protein